jgi:hypothetical protein
MSSLNLTEAVEALAAWVVESVAAAPTVVPEGAGATASPRHVRFNPKESRMTSARFSSRQHDPIKAKLIRVACEVFLI